MSNLGSHTSTTQLCIVAALLAAIFFLAGCGSYGARTYPVVIVPQDDVAKVYYVRRTVWDRERGDRLLASGRIPTGSQQLPLRLGVARTELPAFEWVAFAVAADGKGWYRSSPFVPSPRKETEALLFRE